MCDIVCLCLLITIYKFVYTYIYIYLHAHRFIDLWVMDGIKLVRIYRK